MENNTENEALNNAQPTDNIDYKAEYEKLVSENEKNKRLKDQYSKESADWKNKYNATLSDVEKERLAIEEKEKHYKEIERQFNLGKLQNGLSKTIANEEVSNKIAGYMLDGDFTGAVEEMNKYFASHDEELSKKVTETLLKDTPKLPPQNVNENGGMTKEKLDKMGYNERVEFKNKNPELYEKLTK